MAKLKSTENISNKSVEQILQLSRQIQQQEKFSSKLVAIYWTIMACITRLLERVGYPWTLPSKDEKVLYFGCGVTFTKGTNSDLFALHRYLKPRKRPDYYLSGTYVPKRLQSFFHGIVSEHVFEHMLPTQARDILQTLLAMLEPGGVIQISVPSPAQFALLDNGCIELDILGINDIAYNYGHRFMYDEKTLITLLTSVGFVDVKANSYETSLFSDYLSLERQPQSIYVCGRKRQPN